MNLWSWLWPGKKPLLNLEQQQRLLQLPPSPGLSERSLRQQRWVVVDLETSGLNLKRDQVLSIGAMVIEDGAIDLGQAFERTLLHGVEEAQTKRGGFCTVNCAGCDIIRHRTIH